MNRAQKVAWFNLTVMIAGLVLVVVLAAIGVVKLAAVITLGIGGLVGLSPVLFRQRQGRVSFDERDQLINTRATLIASAATCGYFTAMCMMPLVTVGPNGSVPVSGLIGIVVGALICFVVSKSVATLLTYGWGGKGCEK